MLSLPLARDKTKNIFLCFVTNLKTYRLSHFVYKVVYCREVIHNGYSCGLNVKAP